MFQIKYLTKSVESYLEQFKGNFRCAQGRHFEIFCCIAQDQAAVIKHTRQSDQSWRVETIEGRDLCVELASVDCVLDFAAIYENVNLVQ